MMEEVLSKDISPDAPLKEQDFYELSLLDEANDLGTRYRIRQIHVAWDEAAGEVMPVHEEVKYFWILDEAKAQYEKRRKALAVKGYIYSDMDLS